MEIDSTTNTADAEDTESLPKLETLEDVDEIQLSLNLTEDDVQIFEESESILPDQNYQEQDRFDLLESGIKTCRDRIDGFGQELKFLFVEINIISKFIKEQFGIELIDKASQLRMHIHDVDEIEELTKSFSSKFGSIRRSNRQLTAKWLLGQERRERLRRRKKRFFKKEEDFDAELSDAYIDSDIGRDEDNICLDTKLENENLDENGMLQRESVDRGDERLNRKRRRGRPLKTICSLETEALTKNGRSYSRGGKKEMSTKHSASDEDDEVNQKEDLLCDLECENVSRSKRQRKPRKAEEGDGEGPPPIKKLGRPKKLPEERVSQVHDKTPMQCAECGKILKGSGSLKSHMNMHADLRPYPCLEDGCGKRFRVKNKLQLHQLLHTGDKKEQCKFCGKLFYFLKDLARHERTHTGEKPFECPECQKSFNVKQHLTLHIRTHTGEKPYQCPTCHKRFSQANSLRIHKKIHVKALLAASAGFAPKKPKILTKSKNSPTTAATTTTSSANNIVPVGSNDDELNYPKILTVVVGAGTSLNSQKIRKIQQTETARRKNQKEKGSKRRAEEAQVHLITVNSLNTQLLDSVPKEEDEPNISAGEQMVNIPIYTVEVQQHNRPPVTVIANRKASLKQQRQVQIEGFNPDTSIRYFTPE